MYGWVVKRLRNAEAEHIKNGEDKLAVLCRDAASVVVELNARNKILRDLLHDRDSAIDALNVSLDTYRGLTEAMQQNQQAQWIPVTEMLPEESEGLDWREELMIRFTSVWCCDVNTGTINVRNRFQHKITGIQALDQNIQDTDWHWSTSWWEPTHWMPIVPLPEPPKEKT